MPFNKGQSGNAAGRKVGSTNKLPAFHREFIQTLLDGQQERIAAELSQLQGRDYFNAVNALIEFVLPKLQRTEIVSDYDKLTDSQLETIIWELKNK